MPPPSRRPSWLGNRSIETRGGLVFAGVLAMVLAEGATNFYIFQLEQSNRDLITHTYDILLQLSQMEFGLVGQQSNLRALLLPGALHVREDFQADAGLFDQSFAQLGDLTRDDPGQQRRLAEIRSEVAGWHADFVDPLLAAAALPNGHAQAVKLLNQGTRIGRLRAILAEARAMKTAEQELLAQRRDSLDHSLLLIRLINTGFVLVWLMLIGLVVRLSSKLVSRPVQALADIITRLANHEYDVNIGWQRRGDEIGAIARALTVLSDRSKEADEQAALLRVSGESLRVQARRLAESNDELQQKTIALDEKNRQLELLQQETQEKAQQLERVSRYRADFVANTSHELRTPLNSMLILSKLLADNIHQRLSPEEEENARIIHESGSGLLLLINDILDLSKMEAGKVQINVEEVLLETAIARWRRSFRALARERKIKFAVEASFDAPLRLETDPGRLDQIVNNLVSNAFKFTDEGEVRVYLLRPPVSTVYRREELAQTETFLIRVSDTGIGIAEDQLGRVFQAFEQIDARVSRSYGGTGLGLSITRSLVELLGGEIHLESHVGKGSIFSVYLPVLAQATARRAPPQSLPIVPMPPVFPRSTAQIPDVASVPAGASPAERKKGSSVAATAPATVNPRLAGRSLLIVDNDMRENLLLAKKLRDHGLKVLLAPSADKAIASLGSTQIEWCLIDVDSRALNGKEVIRRIRGIQGLHRPRLIAMSSSTSADGQRESRDVGADELLAKPPDIEALVSLLQTDPPTRKAP